MRGIGLRRRGEGWCCRRGEWGELSPPQRDCAPSPRLRGEGRGEGGLREDGDRGVRGDSPSPGIRAFSAYSGLSPQAGRGEETVTPRTSIPSATETPDPASGCSSATP